MRSTSKKFIAILLACAFYAVSFSSLTQAQEAEPEQENSTEQSTPDNNSSDSQGRQDMTFDRLTEIIGKFTGGVDSQDRSLTFSYNDVPMTLVADERANRMRIITPVVEADQISPEQMLAISLSNFHLALDARYALGGNMLYSTYIHPLKELTAGQVESAVRQVSTLRLTFGTTYSSGEMSFGGPRGPRGQEI